ncbi:MAG TPA: hypothetical protein PLI82_02615 [Candidatus Sumerlaeota bacterium]|nr:hypothetical protein [Candidatus Sumerlaeota bacterium]
MKKGFFAALIVFGLTVRLLFADNSDIRAKVATPPASNGMLFAGASANSSLANVITVAKSGGDYDTIQAAVEAATTGTTVLVSPGEYAEQVFITKAISLIGTDKNNCVIKKSVAGNGGGGAHLVSVKTGIASGYVKIKNLTMWNTYSAYSSTALMIESSARVSNCILIGNHADTLYLRRNCNIYVDRCQISGLYDVVSIDGINHSLEYKISNSTIVSTGSSGANSMPVWIGNNNSNAHINDCDLITHGTTGAAGILVASDSGKTIKMYLTNVRCFKRDYTVVPLFYSNSNGTGTTAYISNCQYSTLGNSNVTAHYLKTSGADMNGNLKVSGSFASADSKFAIDSDGNITKINNVATSFPSSQGAAGAFLKNDGSGNLSWASADGGSSKPSNIITVAKSGGDYDTIQAAVEAATTGTTVLVLPGEYAEQVFITKAISLIGTDKNNCVVKKDVVGDGWGGSHLITIEAGIIGVVEIRNLTAYNPRTSYSGTSLIIKSDAKIRNCDLVSDSWDTVIVGLSTVHFDDCLISGRCDTLSIMGYGKGTTVYVDNCRIEARSTSTSIWTGGGDSGGVVTVYLNDCELFGESSNPDYGRIDVRLDTLIKLKYYITNTRCFRISDGALFPLFFPTEFGANMTAYIANCQYSTLGNSNVTAHYLKTSGADMSGNLKVSGAFASADSKFSVDSDGNITKINNVATSFPSSQGAAGAFLKNDGSGNLSWASADGGSSKPSNVITVAKSGGDYGTIQAAVEAATTGTTVLVFPGRYLVESSIYVNKPVTIIGVDKNSCVVEIEQIVVGKIGKHEGVLQLDADGIKLENLTIRNIGDTTGENTTPAVVAWSGNVCISNCYIGGNGGRDVFCVLGTTNMRCENVILEQYKEASNASHLLWVDNNASLQYYGGEINVKGTGHGAQLNTTKNVGFYYVKFHNAGFMDIAACNNLTIWGCRINTPPYLLTHNYTKLITNFTDYMNARIGGDLRVNGIGVDGNSGFSGDVVFYSKSAFEDTIKYDAKDGKLYFGYFDTGLGDYILDTNLYRPSANTLKTDGVFDANQFYASSVLWKDWAAAAGSGAFVYDAQSMSMTTTVNGALQFFSIPYERGTVLTRLRVKWQAQGAGDGIKVRLIKRDESGTESAWTLVGAQQTYTDADAPYDVAVSVYDFDDETMAANHSYTIEVESAVVSAGVKLFAVGLEMSKRAI